MTRATVRSRPGYVMLMVLLLLLVSSAAVVTLARTSLTRVAAAASAREDLQRRWGTRTLRDATLPIAAGLLSGRSTRRWDVTLGGQAFGLRLADEQAKVNVNGMIYWLGGQRAQEAIKTLLDGSTPRVSTQIDGGDRRAPRGGDQPAWPAADDDDGSGDDRMPVVIGSFGQLFPGSTVDDLRGDGSAAARVTCWGNGMLNFSTAPRGALLAACRGQLTPRQIDRFIAARDADRDAGLPEILGRVGVKNPNFHPLQRRLIGDSWCHSAWITVRTPRGRVYDSLTVRDESPATNAVVSHFEFSP